MRACAPKRPGKVAAPASKARVKPARPAPPAPAPKAGKPEVRVFVSYSHVDKEIRRRLETHLAPLKADNVATWFDGDMEAGEKLDTAIARALREAHVFVGLISSDYLASHYCWRIEYRRAMNRRARGTMRVVAVVVRPCDWKSTPAEGFKLLPEDGRTLQEWRSIDAALVDVLRGIRRVVASVRKEMSQEVPAPKRKSARPAGTVARTAKPRPIAAKAAGATPAAKTPRVRAARPKPPRPGGERTR